MITRSLEVATSLSTSEVPGLSSALAEGQNGSAKKTVPRWQTSLGNAVSSLGELLDLLALDAAEIGASSAAARSFPLRVPRAFVDRMARGDAMDPLLLQVLPRDLELREVEGWVDHPLEEHDYTPVEGLLHKYHGRALMVVTGACAVHCRYCFRRHFPYGQHAASWQPAVAHLAADPSIEEVLLSGGDPLALSDEKLGRLAGELAAIPHLQRLRLHTRLPIVLPERVDDSLLKWLAESRLRPVMVVHVNHPNEIDDSVHDALGRLREAGVMLLNQSVVLRSVNDQARILRDLSVKLFNAGVMPYYLHVMDRVAGAAHFDVPPEVAEHLIQELRTSCPGYLVPKLVREDPGALSKTPLGA